MVVPNRIVVAMLALGYLLGCNGSEEHDSCDAVSSSGETGTVQIGECVWDETSAACQFCTDWAAPGLVSQPEVPCGPEDCVDPQTAD